VLGWIGNHQDYVTNLLEPPYKGSDVSYLWALERRTNLLMVLKNFINLFPKYRREAMNVAQQLRQEGKRVRNIEVAKNLLLKLHLGLDVVQKATGLTKIELEKILYKKINN
jgi:hypothetical protein